MESTVKSTRRNGKFLKDWGPKPTSEAGVFFRKLARHKGEMEVSYAVAKMGLTEKRIANHVRYWSAFGAPVSVKDGVVVMEGVVVKKAKPATHAVKPTKYASKEEAAAAKNARRREARAAKKAAKSVVSANATETTVF